MDIETTFPRLIGKPAISDGVVVLTRDAEEFEIEIEGVSSRDLGDLMTSLDGGRSVAEIRKGLAPPLAASLNGVIEHLERHALMDDVGEPRVRPALDVLLELEDLTNELLNQTLYKNPFWINVQAERMEFPVAVLHGLAIENYHFLFRESFFDSPVLGNQLSTPVRKLMNEFYVDEYGHDELILRGLNALGITREDLEDTMPLPETMALCNALCYWAAADPLFFFSTLGLLEGKDLKKDSYIEACERFGLPDAFVGPIRQHAMINLKGEHGNLTRCIFRELPPIDEQTVKRLRRETHLFVNIYNNFYTAVWEHYSTCDQLLRRVSAL